MTRPLLSLALLAAPLWADSMFPKALEPRALRAQDQEQPREEEQGPARAAPAMISAKVRVAVADVQAALETAPESVVALGGKGLQAVGNARAAFLFKTAPPAELRARLKEAVSALGKHGVVSGYKEELFPPLEMRTAQLSAQLFKLREERQALARALEAAPLSAKVIDAEIARLAELKAEDEPRQAVLTVYFDQENSAAAPDTEILEKAKEKLKEHEHGEEGR